MMSVLNLGTASTAGAKYVAYRELSQLAQGLARKATWAKLEEHLLTKVAQKFAMQMNTRLTQKKLGQFVPIAGIFIGARDARIIPALVRLPVPGGILFRPRPHTFARLIDLVARTAAPRHLPSLPTANRRRRVL